MTHRENVLRRLRLSPNAHLSLNMLSAYTHTPIQALHEIFNRGVGAWKNSIASVRLKKDFSKNPNVAKYPRSARLTKEQWAYARVYSFLDKGTTYYTADHDIAIKYKI